jgi:hypothetical protein
MRGGEAVRRGRVLEGDDDARDLAIIAVELHDGVDRRRDRKPLMRQERS